MSGTRPFGESDIAYITRCRSEGVPFDFPDVIIDGLLATLDAARRASDAQVADLKAALAECHPPHVTRDDSCHICSDLLDGYERVAPGPQPATPPLDDAVLVTEERLAAALDRVFTQPPWIGDPISNETHRIMAALRDHP